MSASHAATLVAQSCSAVLTESPGMPRAITVYAEALGGTCPRLERVRQQRSPHILLLAVVPTGDANRDASDDQTWPLWYTEVPAIDLYTKVNIHNGDEEITINVIFA